MKSSIAVKSSRVYRDPTAVAIAVDNDANIGSSLGNTLRIELYLHPSSVGLIMDPTDVIGARGSHLLRAYLRRSTERGSAARSMKPIERYNDSAPTFSLATWRNGISPES